MKIAVVGAGLAGLVAARELAQQHTVTVFEKARGVGGRMATRYAGEYRFDHGAQFFTARSRAFQNFLQPFIDSGVVTNWQGDFAELRGSEITARREWRDNPPHYVAVPGMNALAQTLAKNLNVLVKTTVAKIERDGTGWRLYDTDGQELGRYDWIIVALPAAQTSRLIGEHSALSKVADSAPMPGCYALMTGFKKPLPIPWQAAVVRDSDLSWVSVNSSKPGRGDAFTLVAHSTNAWAEAHMEDDPADVRRHMLAELSRITGSDCSTADHCDLQRWRYANIDPRSGARCFLDKEINLAACGDWFIRGRVEAAFQSAHSLLKRFAE
ncbi:MAG: FAD-dependent oxidoreductase [Woeseia sp.]